MAKNILVVTEGEKKDVEIVKRLSKLVEERNIHIFPYKANMHDLFEHIAEYGNISSDEIDIVYVLKELATTDEEKQILDKQFVDKVLLFDFDPHDDRYVEHNVELMLDFFAESTNQGQLFINYPMVESFLDVDVVSDSDQDNPFFERKFNHDELVNSVKKYRYKAVSAVRGIKKRISRLSDEEVKYIVNQHLVKSSHIRSNDNETVIDCSAEVLREIFVIQSRMYASSHTAYVLNTGCFFFVNEYPYVFGL